MSPQPSPDDPHFIQAAEEWDLDRLYRNLKNYINEKLTDREKILLRGLLCEYSPKEIAKIAYGKDTSKSIASNLTNLYVIITHLNDHQSGDPIKTHSKNIRRILKFLGYHKMPPALPQRTRAKISRPPLLSPSPLGEGAQSLVPLLLPGRRG